MTDEASRAPAPCYWQQSATGATPQPAASIVSGDVADVVIIGGGFAGLATACRIVDRRPETRVTLLEANHVGYGASGRNGGLLSPLAAPIWLAGALRDKRQADAMRLLYEASHAAAHWAHARAPEAEVEATHLALSPQGSLTRAGVREVVNIVGASGIPLDDAGVRAVNGDACIAAHTVHPYKLACGLAAYARQKNVRIFEHCRVRSVRATGNSARISLGNDVTLQAGKVVIATNAYSTSLELDCPAPGKIVRNFMLATEPLSALHLKQLARSDDFVVELNRKYIFYRLHEGRLVFGGIDKFGASPAADDFEIPARIRETLTREINARFGGGSKIAISHAWGGRFHMTPTDLPVIGPACGKPAIIFNIGYGGTGVALTLALAPVAAALALNERIEDADIAFVHAVMQETRLPVLGGLKFAARVARRLMTVSR